MTLLRESPDPGFLRRLCRVYREKRERVPVLKYRNFPYSNALVKSYDRMPRWAALQIAWHQAQNARQRG